MQGLGFLVVCALAALCVAQSNDTQTQTPSYPFPYQPSGIDVQVNAVLVQKYMSDKYASLILNFQSTMGWLQVSQGWLSMIQQEAVADNRNLEEEDDDDMTPQMFSAPSAPTGDLKSQYDNTERAAEHALLSVIKIMYVQAGHKLANAQQTHYQTKMQLAVLQSSGAQQLGSVVSLMYYLEVLRVMSSAYTIQRQDAWNTWLIHEIIETDVFDNSDIPDTFSAVLAKSQVAAMNAYLMEASTDLQITYLEYYLQAIVSQFTGHAASASASFLEEEATETPAEPSKPFFPFMGMGAGGNPQMMSYYSLMIKFWSVMFNYQAAQGLLSHAVLEEKAIADGQQNNLSSQVKQNAVSALQQWAYLNMFQIMMDFQSFYAMSSLTGGAHHNAAAANAFVQTATPETETAPAAVPEVTAEQKALLESVVSQFLRPQPIIAQPNAQ